MAWAVEAQGLRRTFGSVVALDHADLRVRRGHVFGLLGPNGAGKTTMLHVLLGLVIPESGTARVAGFDVRAQPTEVRRRCGALLEHHGLYERLTAQENLQCYGELYGLRPPEARQAARAALDGLGLWERRSDRVAVWSKGMKQRLAIARSLLHGPEVVFLDEPTNGFDAAAALKLREDLAILARERGLTVFLTTHNLREAEAMCDDVAVLRQGRIVAQGAPDALVQRPPALTVEATRLTGAAVATLRRVRGVREARLEGGRLRVVLDDAGLAPRVVAHLVRAGAQVHEVRRDRPDLEADFVRLLEGGA